MKILCLISSLGPGGAERQITGLGCFLKEAGHEVEFVIYHDDKFYMPMLDENNIKVHIIENTPNKLKLIWDVGTYIKKRKPDWVISFMEEPSVCALFAKFISMGNIKVLVSKRNTNLYCGKSEKFYFNLFRFSDIVTTNAHGEKVFFEKHFPALAKKTKVIVNFVDLNLFKSETREYHKPRRIIVAASVVPKKNVKGFIEASGIVKKNGVNFKVEWYGVTTKEDAYYLECKEKIKELNLDDVFLLKEKITTINEKYRESDVFCLPSFYEGTSNSLCEALASGMPVICSNVCENPLYIKEGENGFLFNPYSVNDMAEKMQMIIIKTDEELISCGKKSRQIAEENFSKEKFVQSYIDLLS